MRRGAKPTKPRVEAKSPVARKAPTNEGAGVRDLEQRLAKAVEREAEALKRESEALDQQTATSKILGVISRTPTEMRPVFETIVDSAVTLCDAAFGTLFRWDGTLITIGAMSSHVGSDERAILEQIFPVGVGPESRLIGRAIKEKQVVHIEDVRADSGVLGHGQNRRLVEVAGYRTFLAVPMLRGDVCFGVINLWRRTVAPFSEQHIALLQTFADQAVIAIENVRLFTELQEKNTALTAAHAQVTETLEQQTATSEILRTIAQAQTDVQPVFDTIVQSAARLCHATSTAVFLTDGRMVYQPANYGSVPEALAVARARFPRPLDMDSVPGMVILTRSVVHVPDIEEQSAVPLVREVGRLLGFRSTVGVPMLREGEAIGSINVARRELGRFSDAEVALLKTFADQAVIAIENVRLFNETKEALEQQTATSEILRAISGSPTDFQPVFDTIVRHAGGVCNAFDAVLVLVDGDDFVQRAHYGPIERAPNLRYPLQGTVGGRAILEARVIQVENLAETFDYPVGHALAQRSGYRTTLSVPLLREGIALGAITIRRTEVLPFSDKQIELLKTFADQAVIAIENVRLFTELKARTATLTRSVEQLTALGEISRAVSSTLDIQAVLDTIVSRATQLAGADGCAIYEYDEPTQAFHVRATHNVDARLVATLRAMPLRRGEGVMGRATETREPIQIADITTPGAYQSHIRDLLIAADYRALLSVPLVREEEVIGSLSLNRKAPGEFAAEVIEVLKTFATQSALAIQNARLFHEIADKSRQLEAASQHKSEFLANMSHELRTPLNAVIGFSEVLLQRMFGELNPKQDEYLKDIYASGQHLLSLINDILDLSKIEAGRMELAPAPFHLPAALENAITLVRERAARHGITLQVDVDPRLGELVGDERKVKQVLLNLLSNAVKFTPEGGRISLKAARKDGVVEIAVTDTGIGIAPEDLETVFEEFRQVGTADKKAEGTGLGLTLARKFVELHGGRIWVTSQVGVGSTFTFTLPVRPWLAR